MSLRDSWTAEQSASSLAAVTFTVPSAVPTGRLLMVAVGRGGGGAVTAASPVRGNAWTIEATGAHTTATLSFGLLSMVVSTALAAGDTFTVTASAASNRWALAAGVFDDFVQPVNRAVSPVLSSAATPVNTGPTPDLAVQRALVVAAVATTGNGYPMTNRANALAAQILSGPSAQRGVALFYKSEGGYPHTSSCDLAASVISVSATVAYECAPLPAGTLPLLTADGEVPGVLSWWNGSSEVAVSATQIAP